MTLPNSIRVGGEVDDQCNTCNMNLAHTILAMVGINVKRVQCNTCGAQHNFRSAQPLAKATSFAAPRKTSAPRASGSGTRPSPAKAAVVVASFDEQLKGKDLTKARKYSVKDSFKLDEVIDHPTFGFGIVSAVRVDKVDITFKSELKTLVHGKGGGLEHKPTFSHARSPAPAFADKPPEDVAAQPSADPGPLRET